MRLSIFVRGVLIAAAGIWFSGSAWGAETKVTINEDNVLVLNGQKVFPIGFTMAPRPGAKTPEGKDGMKELRDAGALFMRTGPMGEGGGAWTDKWIAEEKEWQAAAARAGMYCAPWLKELSALGADEPAKETKFRAIVNMFKDSPALLVWKGEDEPEWGKKSIPPMIRVEKMLKELDPNHPMWIVQAPRGTVETMRAYDRTYDITGMDVYPISYPPGIHSLEKNKSISMVGDYAREMEQVAGPKKPVWMTLQIAWSGVARPGKTLRFPTYPEERFMAYEAVINGARGLVFFGGQLPTTLGGEDAKLGWNWHFWNRVLKPVVEQLGTESPIAPALVAPNSKLALKADAKGIECLVREAAGAVYVLACSANQPETVQVKFSGLPADLGVGEVVFESPRKVVAKEGSFSDWFAPYEVHVYRFEKK